MNDESNVLEKLSKYDVATLGNVSFEVYDSIKAMPNVMDDSNLVKDFQLAMECLEILNEELKARI